MNFWILLFLFLFIFWRLVLLELVIIILIEVLILIIIIIYFTLLILHSKRIGTSWIYRLFFCFWCWKFKFGYVDSLSFILFLFLTCYVLGRYAFAFISFNSNIYQFRFLTSSISTIYNKLYKLTKININYLILLITKAGSADFICFLGFRSQIVNHLQIIRLKKLILILN